jgi:hypothetical protein|uniref:Uncharacterized protein n=1 Tax=Siphoviridae sp. ctmqu18 TaxID=2825655 RepID=A0A8S5V6C3_9CAUD|nr:MAG TPA: hypothetical protein [Siphoviridae sp. ctmqu18]DAI46367.1 MAG TPA: hypothetical protein [Caudoviricetes sp.]
MYNLEFIKDGKEYKKVDKRVARKLFDAGGVVYLAPCKANPCSDWVGLIDIRKESAAFDTVINKFEYYNCNTELGKRAAYYVES